MVAKRAKVAKVVLQPLRECQDVLCRRLGLASSSFGQFVISDKVRENHLGTEIIISYLRARISCAALFFRQSWKAPTMKPLVIQSKLGL